MDKELVVPIIVGLVVLGGAIAAVVFTVMGVVQGTSALGEFVGRNKALSATFAAAAAISGYGIKQVNDVITEEAIARVKPTFVQIEQKVLNEDKLPPRVSGCIIDSAVEAYVKATNAGIKQYIPGFRYDVNEKHKVNSGFFDAFDKLSKGCSGFYDPSLSKEQNDKVRKDAEVLMDTFSYPTSQKNKFKVRFEPLPEKTNGKLKPVDSVFYDVFYDVNP